MGRNGVPGAPAPGNQPLAPLARAVLETALVGALAAAFSFFSARFSLSDLLGKEDDCGRMAHGNLSRPAGNRGGVHSDTLGETSHSFSCGQCQRAQRAGMAGRAVGGSASRALGR